MPTYDYRCEACQHKFEEFQSITAPPIRRCPVCGKNKVRRLIGTGGGLIFKGSGFYATDYRSDSYKSGARSETSSSSSGKTDSGSGSKSSGDGGSSAKSSGASPSTSD
ncbi:MAG: zinc ribbon domain-containing protein [Phycisphaerae bacterium]|nr:zinc ribbon domain-containing protein [Phycisphaerae bacterium]